MAESQIIRAAIEAAPNEPKAAQDDLFAAGNTGAPSPFGAGLNAPIERGRGRPPGSANKRTLALADFILRRYRHPVEAMAAAYSMAPLELLAKMGVKTKGLKAEDLNSLIFRAVAIQMQAMGFVARYVASPFPAVDQQAAANQGLMINIDLGEQKVASVRSHTAGNGAVGGENGGQYRENGADFGDNKIAADTTIEGIFSELSEDLRSEIK